MRLNTFTYPWRVEVRASRFHAWCVTGVFKTLDEAMRAERAASNYRHLSRIRVN